jgi:uncharacterized metal-binding protein
MGVLFVDGCRERVAERSVEKHAVASRVRGLGFPVLADLGAEKKKERLKVHDVGRSP